MSKFPNLYLHTLDCRALTKVEIKQPFAVVLADGGVEGLLNIKCSEPYALAASAGVAGLPYLPGLARSGGVLTNPANGIIGLLVVATTSTLRPEWVDLKPAISNYVYHNGILANGRFLYTVFMDNNMTCELSFAALLANDQLLLGLDESGLGAFPGALFNRRLGA